ncbi:hypothetical protein [Ruania albidiflava]|uniref:hypothetical protein n=1 Tax=Ruania albidiflava TaxID=366586 RepID=UPI0003B55960|nr:hypothetical protein [Ruania albidiflava]
MSERGLGRRSWLWASGVPLLSGGLTLAGLAVATAHTADQPRTVSRPILLGVLVLGACLYLAARALAGRAVVLRRVGAARQQWALAHGWSYRNDGGTAPPSTTALALPRSWQTPRVRAALRGRAAGREANVQTWMLQLRPGAGRRRTSCREVVAVNAATGAHRCAVLSGGQLDPLLITPAWATPGRNDLDAATGTLGVGDATVMTSWVPAIRAAVAARDDLPLTVTVGQGQVVVFAIDDPRTSTMQERLDLAVRVANIVDPQGAPAPDVQ